MTTFTCNQAITVEQLKANLHHKGMTVKEWAIQNGYKVNTVYKVIGGQLKGLHGISHEIAVRLNLKTGAVEVSTPKAA